MRKGSRPGSVGGHAAVLLSLVHAPQQVSLLTEGYASIFIACFAMVYAMAKLSHSETALAAPLLAAASAASFENAQRGRGTLLPPKVASLSALWLAIWAAARKKGEYALVAWSMAFLAAFCAHEESGLFRYLILLQVASCTVALFLTWKSSNVAWYPFPGVWMLALGSLGASFELSLASAVVSGAVLILLARAWGRAGLEPRRCRNLELVGMAWLVAGATLGIYRLAGVTGQMGAVLCLVIAGVGQLMMGLSLARRDSWRRIIGLLSVCLGIFLSSGIAKGFVQGIIILCGSILALGLAVLVAASRREALDEGTELTGLQQGLQAAEGSVWEVEEVEQE
eukprot:TRINITY_DN82699_c0_g1_i1.p1 TRINITY_DN82699_c0_g1~~TRINITY_DN82699_c0_g1_i1.p1  ORF type:complete len:339 (-),score=64.18 TRINITY_DN82699_c0_g1_i1:167-1183(-)